MSVPRRICLAATLALTAGGCGGARYTVIADGAQVPVSLSGSLPDQQGNVYVLGHGLVDKGEFKVKKTKVSVVYGTVPRTKLDISPIVNEQVAAKGGQGVVQLKIVSKGCALNWIIPLTALPFWPGCLNVEISGRVVGLKPGAQPDFKPGAKP